MVRSSLRRLGLAASALCLAMCTFEPVGDEAQADLGDEAPGVPQGPMHRPGQPCLVCHADDFSAAGTIYAVKGDRDGVAGASVELTDVNGKSITATTNAAGNFLVTKDAWQPAYPVHATVKLGTVTATMSSIIGRDGSCASCHAEPASRISAGAVYVAPTKALLP